MPDPEQKDPDQGLRLDTDAWNLIYGDPAGPGNYFIGGGGENGARWSASDGGFTGKVGPGGLSSHIGLGGNNRLQLDAEFKKKQAELGFHSGSQNLFNLYGQGSDLDNYEGGVRGSYALGGGLTMDPSLAYMNKNGDDSGKLGLNLSSGDTRFSSSFGFGGDKGDTLGLGLTNDVGNGFTASRGMNMNFGAGTTENSFKLSDPTQSYGFSQSFGPKGETDTLSFDRKYDGGSFNGSLIAGDAVSGFSLGAAQQLGKEASFNQKLGMSWGDEGRTTTFGLGANLTPMDGLKLGGSLDGKLTPDGGHEFGGKLSQSYRSNGFANTLNLAGATSSQNGDSFKADGSMTGQLLPNLYGSGFGSYENKSTTDPSWFAGGGLTYMPNEKLGLTAAGGYGSEGWEARLQADFFKKKIGGAGALEDQRSKALFSAFLGISEGGGSHMNDVFGKPDANKSWNTDAGPMLNLGVGIGF